MWGIQINFPVKLGYMELHFKYENNSDRIITKSVAFEIFIEIHNTNKQFHNKKKNFSVLSVHTQATDSCQWTKIRAAWWRNISSTFTSFLGIGKTYWFILLRFFRLIFATFITGYCI